MDRYSHEIELKMKLFYNNLSEKDKRHYSAIEALKLKHGAFKYISDLLGCSRQTLSKGIKELESELLPQDKSRGKGGGRKRVEIKNPNIDAIFLKNNRGTHSRRSTKRKHQMGKID
jgi:uncharacterized protein YjaZ